MIGPQSTLLTGVVNLDIATVKVAPAGGERAQFGDCD